LTECAKPPYAGFVRAAPDVEAFLAAPVGRYFAGSKFVTWVHHPRLLGNVYVERLDDRDLAAVARLFALPGHADLRPPLRAIIDGGRLGVLKLPQYDVLRGYVASSLSLYLPLVERLAVVRPQGLLGATVTGLYHDVLAPSGRAQLFDDVAAAFAWLDDADGERARAAVDAIVADVLKLPPLLRRVRDLLDARGERSPLALAAAARALGVSSRTLQRERGCVAPRSCSPARRKKSKRSRATPASSRARTSRAPFAAAAAARPTPRATATNASRDGD
jgi:hypothetical protein